jgi:CBS domain-containing protein
MSIGDICNRETIFTNRDSSLNEAAQLMRQHHVGDLVVTAEKNGRRVPVGIVTDRDLVIEVLARQVDPASVTVGDIMTTDLVTARESDGVFDTLQRMRAKGVRRLPVVDGEGELIGIVSIMDFLDLLAEELTALARLVSRAQARERTVRP